MPYTAKHFPISKTTHSHLRIEKKSEKENLIYLTKWEALIPNLSPRLKYSSKDKSAFIASTQMKQANYSKRE